MISGEIISGLIGALVATGGMIYTYRRGRLSGRDNQHARFEKFYEKLLDLPDKDADFFFDPRPRKNLSAHQKALLVWYFTICEGAWLQMKHSLVERGSAANFLKSLSNKFGHISEVEALLCAEGFDPDFVAALHFDIPDKTSTKKATT